MFFKVLLKCKIMNTICLAFFKNRNRNFALVVLTCYCFGLLLFRAKYTQSIYLFFMIWNLFLAYIPYGISNYTLVNFKKLSNYKLAILGCIWLAFIPNSFYIITDLVHLARSKGNLFWLDCHILFTATVVGFWVGIISLNEFNNIVTKKTNSKIANSITLGICLLCGFGIYIGRILRFNSWDIITNPTGLAQELFLSISKETVLVSLHFGIIITLFYWLSKKSNTL